MKKKLVSIVMGSASDMPVMEEAITMLKELKISFEVMVTSAHRSPERTSRYARNASHQGIEVIIAGAGVGAVGGFVVAAQRVEANPGVVEILRIQSAGVIVVLAAGVHHVTHVDDQLDAGADELLVHLLDDVGSTGIGVLAVVGHGPLRVGNDAELPRLSGRG